MNLKKYQKKRDFKKTNEPKGEKSIKNNQIFVIQKHNSTHLHYDLRIQIQGVLKSWAIPKKPSKIGTKRLAIQTEDHPLEYANFEGEISEGYGKGKVEIWDKGIYKNLKDKSMKKCFAEGKIEIELKGNKLNGNFALIQTNIGENKKNWLFFKTK